MVDYGGFWWRVLAYFIDAIVLNIAFSILTTVLGIGLTFQSAMTGIDNGAVHVLMYLSIFSISLLLNWLYFALMESSSLQATLGKLTVGVVVTDLDGQRITFLRATGRYFAKILSALFLCIGFIMVAFTERKQGLHDLIAKTLVYKTRDPRLVRMDERIFS